MAPQAWPGPSTPALRRQAGGEVCLFEALRCKAIKDGKVAKLEDRRVFRFSPLMQATGKPDKLTGNLANLASYDIDINAMASIFRSR